MLVVYIKHITDETKWRVNVAVSRLRANHDQPLATPLKVERKSYLSRDLQCALKSTYGAATKVARTSYLRRRRSDLHTAIKLDITMKKLEICLSMGIGAGLSRYHDFIFYCNQWIES